jgi:aspartyl-tRNA(Asn)/glutamyl-tRNA(Gln) amidotransferase subunit B
MRRVQALLFSVDAVTTGMELGGLRADVNVSVRRTDGGEGVFEYGGVTGLGQRTEIKNLSSFKAVEDAIVAERDRQIAILRDGGVVEGETRGWSLSEPGVTRRLRGKEGEVDYRYMPDPDIPPVYIDRGLIRHLAQTLPPLPEELAGMLCEKYRLSTVDAWALLLLDDGRRMDYFQDVVDRAMAVINFPKVDLLNGYRKHGRVIGNWTLHELGALLTQYEEPWTPDLVPSDHMGDIVGYLEQKKITQASAKQLLRMVFEGERAPVSQLVEKHGFMFVPMSTEEYVALVDSVTTEHADAVRDIQEKGKHGKIKFLLGQMMRQGKKGSVEAAVAEAHLRQRLFPELEAP